MIELYNVKMILSLVSEPMQEVTPHLVVFYCVLLRPTQVKFVLLSQPRLPESASDSLDFVILYDVLVHVDLHITNKYIREIARVLKPGGKAFLSTANFLSPGT